METEKIFIEKYPDVNTHYLQRYIKLINNDYSKYDKFEKHHILPKSLFPEFSKNRFNLIKLPVKAHFLCHWILVKMLPQNIKMNYALYLMGKFKKYKVKNNSKLYEQSRIIALNDTKINLNRKLKLSLANLDKVAKGNHPLQGNNNPMRKLASLGKHPNSKHSGKSTMANIKPWNNVKAVEASKNVWALAENIQNFYKHNSDCGRITVYSMLEATYKNKKFSEQAIRNVLNYLKKGWTPDQDPDWVEFFNSYTI